MTVPLMPNENRAVVESLEKAEGLPNGLLQGLVEKRNGWRPQFNFLPDMMLPPEDRGENKTEQEVMTQNLVGAKALKNNIDYFGGNAPLGVHAFLYGADATEDRLQSGFKQSEVNDLMDVARRQKNIAGEPLTQDDIDAFENTIGKPEPKIYKKQLSKPPAPIQPVSLKRGKDGKYYTGDPLYDAILKIESGGDANAVSPTGAKGLFQFTKGTGKQYGIYGGKQGDIRANPEANFLAMKRLTKDNSAYLKKRGVPVNPTTIYLAHQQGAGGMVQLWNEMNGKGKVSDKVRKNMGLNWGTTSARDYYNIAQQKVSKAMGGAGDYQFTAEGQANDITGTSAEGADGGAPVQEPTIPDYQKIQDTGQSVQVESQFAQQAQPTTSTTDNIQQESQAQVAPTSGINNLQADNPQGGISKPTVASTGAIPSSIKPAKVDWKKVANEVFKPQSAPIYTNKKVNSAIKGAVKDILV